MRRAAAIAVTAATGLLAAACGQEDRPEPAPKPVRLSLSAPADRAVVDGDTVQIVGSVSPVSATVTVRGRSAEVVGGRFSADVDLDPGTNVIDVSAAAGGRRPTLAALRVIRQMPVEVPELGGEDPGIAMDRLEALGLRPEIRERGGLFDDLLPGTAGVCGTDPGAGEHVRPGTSVRIDVAKAC